MAHVVRAFENPEVAHVRATLDPRPTSTSWRPSSCSATSSWWSAALDKTRKAARSGDKAAKRELEVLEALHATLMDGTLAKRVERSADDEPLFRELALVSDRPVLFVLNIDDDQSAGAALAAARGLR